MADSTDPTDLDRPTERRPRTDEATATGGAAPVDRPTPRAVGPARGNGRPGSPAEAREEIARTRARLSETLDRIEDRIEHERAALERQKKDVVDRITLRKLREKLGEEPWRSMAIAFAAGYIIAAIRD